MVISDELGKKNLSMNFTNQDSFLLPPCCKRAAMFFEESDYLRENAVNWNDLLAAYYLRWKGINVCINMIKDLPPQESALVTTICNKLLEQFEDMKKRYDPNEKDGMVWICFLK